MVTLAAKTRFVSGSVREGVTKTNKKIWDNVRDGGEGFFSFKNVPVSIWEF